MKIRSNKTVKNSEDQSSTSGTPHFRDSVLTQLQQLGMNVDDDNLLAELDTLGEDGLIAVLGLFGLLGYFALLGLLGTHDSDC